MASRVLFALDGTHKVATFARALRDADGNVVVATDPSGNILIGTGMSVTPATGVITLPNMTIDGTTGNISAPGGVFTGNFEGALNASIIYGTPQALVAAGAVSLLTIATTIASAGAIALTLDDGSAGQLKSICMIADGGDATLTPAHLQGGTTLTFGDVGDIVLLQFLGTKWQIISNNGATLA